MANSKKDKTRANKAEKFKENAKKAAAQAAIPKHHLIPQTEWKTTDVLDLRGDLAEAFEIHMVKAFESLQAAGETFRQLMSLNIQAGKVKITYIWNNGEIPTEKEVQEYQKAMDMMQKQREQFEKAQRGEVEPGTVLETVGGAPLTEENLEAERQDGGGLIILP
jgi:hypothetical protein